MDDKKRILLVLCGGTICTEAEKRNGMTVRSINEEKEVLLKRNFITSDSDFSKAVEITETENLGILSENMTIGKWNEIIWYIRGIGDIDSFDGIVIAHGTDTLAYSSSLFSLIFKALKKPVFLVSSNMSISEAGANGDDNFRAAVELICCGIRPGTYVTYRNTSDGMMYLHLGSRLLQCRPYEDSFYSQGMIRLADEISREETERINGMLLEEKEGSFDGRINISGDWKLLDCVLRIEPYVGLDYSRFRYEGVRAVLHGTYHSGTVCENGIMYLLDNVEQSLDVYISPSSMEGAVYETTCNVADHGGSIFLHGMTGEMTYVKLVLAYSLGDMTKEEILLFLNADISGEQIY